MIIFGIDPSLSCLGWGALEIKPSIRYLSSGIIKTCSKQAMHKRLARINFLLSKEILKYKPNIIGMEETFVNSNNQSSLKLAYVRGSIMSLIGTYNISFQEYAPNVIKKSLTGYGHAAKSEVLKMLKMLLNNFSETITLDEADALAVAYCASVYRNYL